MGGIKLLKDRRWLLIAVLAVAALTIWAGVLFCGQPQLSATFLDVGDGLCAVVRTPGGKTMVFDCGTSSWRKCDTVGEKLVAPYLQSLGVDTIDVAVLSHPHADHVSGYAGLLTLKPAKLVVDLGCDHTSHYYREFLDAVDKCGAKYRKATRGQIIDFGDGVTATVLNPSGDRDYGNLNNQSIALRLTYRNTAFLLAADTEAEAERYMLGTNLDFSAQVLQVGHHGSETSSTLDWLQAVRPKIAVISCARKSEYNNPDEEVVERLQQVGARLYVTGKHGAITITTDGQTIDVRAHCNP